MRAQYSIRSNRVYDMTIRRRFCSDQCFEASQMVKLQLPSEPFWMTGVRKPFEIRVPKIDELQGKRGDVIETR